FDPGSGRWYLRDSNSSGPPNVQPPFVYGLHGWVPLTGDWNGDGQTTVGVFDPSGFASPGAGVWYLRNSNSSGPPDVGPFPFGARNWIPVAGDWDGNGTTTVGVFDPATATWYLRNSNSPGIPDVKPFVYGLPGWIPVAGDWDGDGTTTIGVVDPATMTWYLR